MSNHEPLTPLPAALPLSAVLEVRDTCLCFATQRAARVLARRFDAAFRSLGITNNQFSLMMPLNAPSPMTLGQLCVFLGMDQTTMSAALKGLERAGLIDVRRDEKDRRIRRPALTAKGQATLRAALPIWRAEHDALERNLPEGTAQTLRDGLGLLATGAVAAKVAPAGVVPAGVSPPAAR